MNIPNALMGDRWTEATARNALPILVSCAKQGTPITYGQLDAEIVTRRLGHHVLPVQYGHAAGAIGNALIELEKRWGTPIPPLNAIVVNGDSGFPGSGVHYYLEHYYAPKKRVDDISADEKRAVVSEIQADVFAYEHWDDVLKECELIELRERVKLKEGTDNIATPRRGGWSSEPGSVEHQKLKVYIAKNPQEVGLPSDCSPGQTEYLFASADTADVVFHTANGFLGVEVKSIISNNADLNRGLFQAVKYQALLRAKQKARSEPPTARAVLVTEQTLSKELQNLAERLGIAVFKVCVN